MTELWWCWGQWLDSGCGYGPVWSSVSLFLGKSVGGGLPHPSTRFWATWALALGCPSGTRWSGLESSSGCSFPVGPQVNPLPPMSQLISEDNISLTPCVVATRTAWDFTYKTIGRGPGIYKSSWTVSSWGDDSVTGNLQPLSSPMTVIQHLSVCGEGKSRGFSSQWPQM